MTDNSKPAYFVVCGTSLGETDAEYFKRSIQVALKADTWMIAGGEVESKVKVLEGELPPGTSFVAVEKFPSMAALEEFYYSEAYQSAIPFRKESIEMKFMLAVEGLSGAEQQAQREAILAIGES